MTLLRNDKFYYFISIYLLLYNCLTHTDTLSVGVWKRTGGECSAALVKVYLYHNRYSKIKRILCITLNYFCEIFANCYVWTQRKQIALTGGLLSSNILKIWGQSHKNSLNCSAREKNVFASGFHKAWRAEHLAVLEPRLRSHLFGVAAGMEQSLRALCWGGQSRGLFLVLSQAGWEPDWGHSLSGSASGYKRLQLACPDWDF